MPRCSAVSSIDRPPKKRSSTIRAFSGSRASRSPRHQAVEYPGHRRRHPAATGLRHCQAAGSGAVSARGRGHDRRAAADDAEFRQPRAGARGGDHHRLGRLLPRRPALPVADRPAAAPPRGPVGGGDRAHPVRSRRHDGAPGDPDRPPARPGGAGASASRAAAATGGKGVGFPDRSIQGLRSVAERQRRPPARPTLRPPGYSTTWASSGSTRVLLPRPRAMSSAPG